MSFNRVYLIGLMGAGKSTVGKILAEAINWQFWDIDEAIETSSGKDISSIFETQGEKGFRDYETQALMETSGLDHAIIPCGGGIVTREENIQFLRDHLTVWLDVSPEEAASRLEHSDNRPLLNGCQNTLEKLRHILDSRQLAYEQAASIHMNTSGKKPEGIANEILEKLEAYHD